MEQSHQQGKPNLAATSWALLGMLSDEYELSGYDMRKWIEWSMRFFYGSPAYSQIYSELKKLEQLGLVTSRVENSAGTRNRRLYKITDAGMDAVTRWANDAPLDPPVLKHTPLLRVTLGHLTNPARLKEMLQEHLAYADEMTATRPRTQSGRERIRRGRTRASRCSGPRGITPTSVS